MITVFIVLLKSQVSICFLFRTKYLASNTSRACDTFQCHVSLFILLHDVKLDYMDIVSAESEELANSIDPGTALSIELASTAGSTAPMLLAARKRRQQLSLDPSATVAGGSRTGRAGANQLRAKKRPCLNAFGDSEDEADEEDDEEDDDDDEEERAAALVGSGGPGSVTAVGSDLLRGALAGPLDLYRLRQLQRAK